jgi:hypothetical protein
MFERWQSLPPNKVQPDPENNRYIIPFDIGIRLAGRELQPADLDLLKISALNTFLDYLGIPPSAGVQYEIEGEQETFSPSELARKIVKAGETFTNPARPNLNTLILFSFDEGSLPKKVEDEQEETTATPEVATTEVVASRRIIAVAFHSDEIDSLIKDAQNNIRYFQVRAENFNGTIQNLSFDEDIKKLSLILPKIKKFLSLNDITFSSSETQTLEFQFNEDYKLQRFFINLQDGVTKEPKIGFRALASEDPFSSYRVMFYFIFLKQLADTKARSLTLMDFIETFVEPKPDVQYGEQSAIDQVKKLQREQRREGDECIENPAQDLVDFIKDQDSFNAFTKDYVTLFNAHKEAVQNKFDRTEFHPVLGKDTQAILEKITTAEDLYKEWWRKADGKEIASRLLQCLGIDLPTNFCFTPNILEPNILGFNEDLPVIDWTGDFVVELENSLTTFLADTMLAVAQGLLNQLNLKEVCETAINDILSEKPSFVGAAESDITIGVTIGVTLAGTRREKRLSQSVRDFFEIGEEDDLSNVNPEKYAILRQELIAIIEDLFLVLTNEEICRLFEGESNEKDIFYIQSIVKTKYTDSPARFLFETATSIRDTFSELGKQISLDFCQIQLSPEVQNLKIYDLCTLRSDLVDDCLGPEQLDAELEKLRKAKCEQIERLRDIIENGFAPDTIPPALCSVDENGNKIPGLVNEPATSAYVINNAIDASFENIYTSFSSEAEGWKENFITIEDSTKQVDVLIGDELQRVNPEIQTLISQGQPEEQFYDLEVDGTSIVKKEKGDNKADVVRKGKSVGMPLFQALNNELSDTFLIKENDDSIYFQIDIPASPEKESLNSLLSQIKALQAAANNNQNNSALDKVTQTIVDACSKENEGKITPDTIRKIIDDLGSGNEIRKVFNASSLINRPDLFELDNIRYSLRFAQEKISGDIEDFVGYQKSNYISLVANIKDDQNNDVEYEIVRFYGEDVDSDIKIILDSLEAPKEDEFANQRSFESFAFAKYCTSRWQDNGFDVENARIFLNLLFSGNYYYDILGFINSYMLEKIVDSPFFNTQRFESIDLNPPRTQREIECNIQNNLLIIDNNKQKIIDDYNRNKCDTRDLIINGKPNPNKLNPLDLALLKQQALTLVRLYIIDYCLRGIFPISVFKKDSSVEDDRTFIAFIYEMMTEELKSFDNDFYNTFENICLEIYLDNNNNEPPPVADVDIKEALINDINERTFLRTILEKQSSNQDNIDAILEQEEPSDDSFEEVLQMQNAIKFLIKDQISNVYDKILLALNSAGIPELKGQFLKSLPETFVAKDVDNDTFRYLDDLIKNIRDERDIESLRGIIDLAIKSVEEQIAQEQDADRKFGLEALKNAILEDLKNNPNVEEVANSLADLLNVSEADFKQSAFSTIEAEASKLNLSSKFFVEKYCVVQDYSEEELTNEIEKAKAGFLTEDPVENQRITSEFRAQKQAEITNKRQELDGLSIQNTPSQIITVVSPYQVVSLGPDQIRAFRKKVVTENEFFLVKEIENIISKFSFNERDFMDSIANSTNFNSENQLIVFFDRSQPIPIGYYFDLLNLKIYRFTTSELLREAGLTIDEALRRNAVLLSANGFSRDFVPADEISYSTIKSRLLIMQTPDNFNFFKNIVEESNVNVVDNQTRKIFAGDITFKIEQGIELYSEWKSLGLDLLRGPGVPTDNRATPDIVNLILNRDELLKPANPGDEVILNPSSLSDFLFSKGLKTYKLSTIFKAVRYGIRLVLIPDEDFAYNALSVPTEAADNIQNKKLFNLKQVNGGLVDNKHPFAVAEYEIDSRNLNFRDSESKVFDTKIFNLLPNNFFYDSFKRQLLEGLKESRGYKFLFDYSFPLYDLSSYHTIFSSIAASKQQGVPIAWDGTKAALILLISMTNNRGRFDHMSNQPLLNDPAEFSKAFDKAFDVLQSCGSLLPCNLINAGLGGLSSFGFAMKFAIRTPKLIFKGLTELIDPNISIASKIKCIGGTELPIELVSLSLLPAPLIPPPFGIGPPLTPLGIAYLLLFGSAFDLGTDYEFDTGDILGGDEGPNQGRVVRSISEDCSE